MCNSNYYDIDEFNEAVSKFKPPKTLSFVHSNIRSASKNANSFSIYLSTLNHQFDIIALSETWLSDTNDDIVGFPNYSQIHRCRSTKKGGGVTLLLHNHMHFHELEEFSRS